MTGSESSLYPTSVAMLMKIARGAKTQAQFAAWLGVTQSEVSRYESGTRCPPLRVLDKVLANRAEVAEPDEVPRDISGRLRAELEKPENAELNAMLIQLLKPISAVLPSSSASQQ